MRTFTENVYVEAAKNVDDALGNQNYPASGSYIDVSGYRFFAFLVHAGDNWGVPVFQVRQDTAATETASIKDVTGATFTGVATDDDKWHMIEVEVAKLDGANDFNFVTLKASATATEEADIILLAWGARHAPVTQPSNFNNKVVVSG